jgi:hypothetical protein
MSDSLVPVIAGMAVGIAFIVLFSLAYKPAIQLSDAELIEKTKTMKEVQFFLQKYPDAKSGVDRSALPDSLYVTHSVQIKLANYGGMDDGIREKQLIVIVDPYGSNNMALSLSCLAPVSVSVDDGITIDLVDKFCA